MKRRNFLISASALGCVGGAAWLVNKSSHVALAETTMTGHDMSGMGMSGGAPISAERIEVLPEGAPLNELVKLSNISNTPGVFEGVLEAGEASHEFVPGRATKVLAYNGAIPGAMIEAMEGDRVRITFKNRIPGQISTIHWHGLDVPADQDGNPMDPVESGDDRAYEFTIPMGSAGSYWYHPHPHGFTAEQVYRGLAAPFIVRSKSDPLGPEFGDTMLFISSVSLNVDKSISENTMADMFNGREGDHVLVNGAKQPVLTLPPGSSRRFRLYNATNGRFLRLSLEGHDITLAGTDGGLIATPINGLKDLLLAPAERAEIIVNFRSQAGRVALTSMPYERGWMGDGKPAAETTTLMTFDLVGEPTTPIEVPSSLRELSALGEPVVRKRLEFVENMGMANGAMTMAFLIDGKSFDMNRIDLRSRVGEVELWEIHNGADMDHPMHIHGTQFQVVEREKNGKKVAAPFLAWKDTVNITSQETVRIKVRHSTPGLRMYHCHILEHEHSGMMGLLEVV